MPDAESEPKAPAFSWRGFFISVGTATFVTTMARLCLHQLAIVQIAVFFTFYVIAGLWLLVGTAQYALRQPALAGRLAS